MDIKSINFEEFNYLASNYEGIVLLGSGGDLSKYVDGISQMFFDEKISQTVDPYEMFSDIYLLETTEGRSDLAFIFNPDYDFDIGKMAIWRLCFGDCSWVSDYVVNYSSQFA